MTTDPTILQQANEAIVADLINELKLQGHHLTGALEESIKPQEIAENGGITLTAEAAGYLETLEKGIAPENIQITPAALAQMTQYVTLRMGYQGSKATQVAYLILKKQREEGNPTKNSYSFSQTGDRKNAIADTFQKNEGHYTDLIDTAVINQLDGLSNNQLQSGII